jgi:Protein of unknown function (DUF3054)
MQLPSRVRFAPVLDALCIFVFVLVGRGRHEIDEGIGWFFTVLWPLYLGWFAVALATKLYTRVSGIWTALGVTWLGGIAVASLFRGTFTDRPYVGIFTVIAIAFIGLTTFGWRLVAALIVRSRRESPQLLDG